MKIRIGNIEIEDVSLDELDEIVARYGDATLSKPSGSEEGAAAGSKKANGGGNPQRSTPDTVLLKKFNDAQPGGVKTGEVGAMLGKQGKAIRPAAKVWAHRIGLTQDESVDPFSDCRVGTQRGMKINEHLVDLAKELAKG